LMNHNLRFRRIRKSHPSFSLTNWDLVLLIQYR